MTSLCHLQYEDMFLSRNMELLLVLLLMSHVASSVKHSLKLHLMISSGDPNIPGYLAFSNFEGVKMSHYETGMKSPEPRSNWFRNFTEENPQLWKKIAVDGINYEHDFRAHTNRFKRHNQSEGVDIIQQMLGYDWDNETNEVYCYNNYGYNGRDFLIFDIKTETWIAANSQAVVTKQKWDGDAARKLDWKVFLTKTFAMWMKNYMIYADGLLQRRDLPSVSLLQKSPSSPVTCHATGFYPDKAMLLWRKDGEELHEDVEGGEVLPNHDGSFQMSVDLDLSSVQPEDWGRYDCVFQLSGVNQDTVTKLDRAVIRSNSVESSNTTVHISVAVVAAVVIISITGLIVYQRKKDPENISELTEKMNPEPDQQRHRPANTHDDNDNVG